MGMDRRGFLGTGALGAGSLLALGASAAWASTGDAAGAADVAGSSGVAAAGDAVGRELPAPIARLAPRSDEPPPISEAERAERRAKAQRLMAERGVVAMFIEPGANLTYYADVPWGRSERVFGMLLPQKGDAIIVSPAFEKERASLGVKDRFEIRAWQEDESPYALIVKSVKDAGFSSGKIAVDDSARVFVFEGVATAGAPSFEAVSAAPVVHKSRGVKSAHEIAIMRYANEVTLQAYHAAFETMHPGMTQRELAQNVSAGMRKLGYEGYALVLFGESSAYPHGAPNPQPIGDGTVVLVDGGLTVHGYESDDTRTVTFGAPTPEAQKVWDTVREAQQIALHAAAPGKPAGSVDAAAREFIAKAGYGPGYRLFTHRLGHGIGLEGHEYPYLVRGSDIPLEPGMTFSDEPGIYQYGKFGVRLEDIIAITDSGAEMLTQPATQLRFDVA